MKESTETKPKSSSACSVFFRLLFGVALICLGAKGLYEVGSNHGFVSQNIRLILELIHKESLLKLRMYSTLIVTIQNYLFLLSGFFVILGVKFGKLCAFVAVLIDLVLVHNPYFYGEPKYKTIAALYLGIFGAVLNN